ncbi:MAG: Aminopeptidase [Firmicutes bacterium]|nr:Aminopeptidase [Bacillota bacterium]
MKDIRLKKLANLLVNYSLEIKEGEYVLIYGSTASEPLLKELYREIIRVGGHPEVLPIIEGAQEILLKNGSEKQLQFVSPLDRLIAEKYDAVIYLWGGYNTKALSGIDPNRIAMRSKSMRELADIRNEREEKGEYRWCGTQFPTHSDAQEAKMSLEEYEDFVFSSGHIDSDDPIEEWKNISKYQQRIVDYLNTKQEIHVVSNNTDLKMSTSGRKWINCDGKANFPDGEVFTSPVEDSVEGYIRFSFPGIFQGKEIEDIRLEFREGKVLNASAAKGEELLSALLNMDEGARRLGEFAIGTNSRITRFTRNMLFDEKIGGTVHAAIGFAPSGTGGKNRSGIHWDMLCDMKEEGRIYADGELFYRNGAFIDEVIDGLK